jgi:methyltransferase
MSATSLVWVFGAIPIVRAIELLVAELNTRRLLAEGWNEVGAAHYPLFILLHASLLVAIALTTPLHRQPIWPLVGMIALLQVLRFWTMATLDRHWTTRGITRDDIPPTTAGPCRFLRQPTYATAAIEVAALPLAFGE